MALLSEDPRRRPPVAGSPCSPAADDMRRGVLRTLPPSALRSGELVPATEAELARVRPYSAACALLCRAELAGA